MTLETTRRGLEDLLWPAGTEALPIRLIAQENGALPGLSTAERAWVEAWIAWRAGGGPAPAPTSSERAMLRVAVRVFSCGDHRVVLVAASPKSDGDLVWTALSQVVGAFHCVAG